MPHRRSTKISGMKQTIENLVAVLTTRLAIHQASTDQPYLIAIDGQSGAGKSTIAQSLTQHFEVLLIAGDDFYVGGTAVRHDSPKVLADICIDRKRLLGVLQKLKSNQMAQYKPFDWQAFDGALAKQDRIMSPCAMLVLEGVYANHPDLAALIDFSILLEVPEEERERRLRDREGKITDWERQWHHGEKWYFENIARPENFDAVIVNI